MSNWIKESPEESGEYLCAMYMWDKLIFQKILFFDGFEWTDDLQGSIDDVIAWQPLPSTDELELK